ncbi:DEAD/DEAH box helicase family protein [Sneathiella sp.]|uniref:type I restriction endonuclease subunit R, EcoR124 family n=1 Tax=Sneathiella sp. TaxID=1964365 RepID=UPI003561AB62
MNSLKLGTLAAGGYVWHTMGSGKTRTSFKATQLASRLPSVDKVLFVVDRKDLEYQTMREYDRFEKEAANSNTLTAVLKPHREYYSEYADKVQELLSQFPLGTPIVGEDAQKDFIALFGAILRLQNILTSFEGFVGDQLLTVPQGQDYRNVYLDLYAEFRRVDEEGKERIIDDVVFEIELIKQVAINVDSILMLVQKYCDEHGDGDDKEIRTEITRAIDASPSLRNKKELIEAFVDRISAKGNVDEEWVAFVLARREEEPASIIKSENLRPDATRAFIESAFRDGQIHTTGTAITKVLPPASRFSAEGGHGEKKQRVLGQLSDFFERFFGLSSGGKD